MLILGQPFWGRVRHALCLSELFRVGGPDKKLGWPQLLSELPNTVLVAYGSENATVDTGDSGGSHRQLVDHVP